MSLPEEKSDILENDNNQESSVDQNIIMKKDENIPEQEIEQESKSQVADATNEIIEKQIGESRDKMDLIFQKLQVQSIEEAIIKINSIINENSKLKNDAQIIQTLQDSHLNNTQSGNISKENNVPYAIDNNVCFEDYQINSQKSPKIDKMMVNPAETDSGDENIDQFISDYIKKESSMDLTKIIGDDPDEIDVENNQIKKENSSQEDLYQSTFTKSQIESVYNQMKTLAEENAKLTEKIDQLESNEKRVNMSGESLQQNQSSITDQDQGDKGNKSIADLDYQLDLNERLAKTIEELEEANKKAYEEIDSLKQENLELTNLNEALIQTNERLENEAQVNQHKDPDFLQDYPQQEEQTYEIEILQTKIKQSENEKAEMQSKIDNLQQANIDLDDQNEQLKAQINQMKNSKEQSLDISISKDNLQDRIAELESELSKVNREKNELNDSIESLKKWDIQKDEKITKLKEKKNALKQELASLKVENDKLTEKINEIQNSNESKDSTLAKLKEENEQFKAQLLELQTKEQSEVLIEEEEESASDPLKSDAEVIENEQLPNEEINSIEINAEIVDNDSEDYKSKYDEIKNQLDQVQEMYQQLLKDNERLSTENKDLVEQTSNAQNKYEKLFAEHQDAITEIQELKSELDSLRSKAENENKQTESTEFDATELNSVDALNSDNEELFEEEKLAATAPVITYVRDSFLYENPLNFSRNSQILPSEQNKQKRETMIPPPSPTRKTAALIQQRNLELENAYNEALEMQYQIVEYARERLVRLEDTLNDFLSMALAKIEVNKKALLNNKIKAESLVKINSMLVKSCQELINSVWHEYQTTSPPLISKFANLLYVSPQKATSSKIQPSRISSRVYKNSANSPNNNGETLFKIVKDAINIQTVGIKSIRQNNQDLENRLTKAEFELNEERQNRVNLIQQMQKQQKYYEEKQRTSTLTPQVEQLVQSFASDIKTITNKMVSNHAALFGGTKMNSSSNYNGSKGSNSFNNATTSDTSSNYLMHYPLHQSPDKRSNSSQNEQFMVSFSSYSSYQKDANRAHPQQKSSPIMESKPVEEKKLTFNPYATYFNKNMQQRLGPTHIKPNEEEIEEEEEEKEEKYHYTFGV